MVKDKRVKENREFGLLVGSVFLFFAAYSFFRKAHINLIFTAVGLALIIVAMLFPLQLTVIKAGWEKLGRFLGYINTVVLLTVVYFIILTPMAVLNRLLANDSLKLKANAKAQTYWEPCQPNNKLEMKQQF